MARPLRIEFEDALYHITARGNAESESNFCDRTLIGRELKMELR